MQNVTINSKGKPLCVDLGLQVKHPAKVRIAVVNSDNPQIVYYDRYQTIKSNADFEVRLPQTNNRKKGSKKITFKIFCDGNVSDSNVRITKFKQKTLPSYAPCYLNSKGTKSFVRFAQAFVERINELPTGTYTSKDGKFQIDLFDTIVDNPSTPARISNSTGRIEVSKQYFSKMTIPMMMAILCHEYSHFYLNEDIHDEIEADLNGLKIYLGLGYPIIESHKSFLRVFDKTDTAQNRERYEYIYAFVQNWDKIKTKICI